MVPREPQELFELFICTVQVLRTVRRRRFSGLFPPFEIQREIASARPYLEEYMPGAQMGIYSHHIIKNVQIQGTSM